METANQSREVFLEPSQHLGQVTGSITTAHGPAHGPQVAPPDIDPSEFMLQHWFVDSDLMLRGSRHLGQNVEISTENC